MELLKQFKTVKFVKPSIPVKSEIDLLLTSKVPEKACAVAVKSSLTSIKAGFCARMAAAKLGSGICCAFRKGNSIKQKNETKMQRCKMFAISDEAKNGNVFM